VDGRELRHAFQFDDHASIDSHVDFVSPFELHGLVVERQADIVFNGEPTCAQLVHETGLIRGFEQTRSQSSVNRNGRLNDQTGDAIDFGRANESHAEVPAKIATTGIPSRLRRNGI
jgi:hypothetical protein